jgi:hypothetical protein
MLGYVFSVRFVGEPFADLGQMVLTLGLVEGGQEFGARAHQVTPAAEQVSGRPHFGGIDLGLREHPAPQ